MDPNLQIRTNSGCKELLLRKLSYAVTSSVLSQVIILIAFLFVISFNVLHPIEWIYLALRTSTSVSTWLFVIPFLTIIFAQSIVCARDYVFQLRHCLTRFQKIFTIFSLHNFMLLILHISIGGLTVWLFLSLAGGRHGNIYEKCESGRNCLVGKTFFLITCGMWIGLYYFLRIYSSEKRILFPVVQQLKLPQFKSRLVSLIKESNKMVLQPMIYYVIFYFCFGKDMQDSFASFFKLQAQKDSAIGILIYFYAWFFSVLYMFNMNLMRFFFELFLTEYIQFPIDSQTKNDLTLIEALNINSIPIVQHLAALDLFLLSHNSKPRREIFYTLSQPGNHPLIWNNLIECTLKIINEHTGMINKAVNTILAPEQTDKFNFIPQSPPQSPLLKNYTNMRNMSLQNVNLPLDVITVSHNKDLALSVACSSLKENLSEKFKLVVKVLKTKLGINYLFGELPTISVQYCLSNGQIIMWVMQGLSSLVTASLKEDKFGVVQKDIPVIISTFVDLKQSLEKLNRVPAFARKGHGLDDFDINMKNGISSAVRRSLYNICSHFGPYLKDLSLNKDVTHSLNMYVSSKSV